MNEPISIARYLEAAPSDEETARRSVELYLRLDTTARLQALADLLRGMDEFLAGRLPRRSPDDENFWRHWQDPTLGRPR